MRQGTGKVYAGPKLKNKAFRAFYSFHHLFICRVGVSNVRNIKATQQTDLIFTKAEPYWGKVASAKAFWGPFTRKTQLRGQPYWEKGGCKGPRKAFAILRGPQNCPKSAKLGGYFADLGATLRVPQSCNSTSALVQKGVPKVVRTPVPPVSTVCLHHEGL